VSEQAQAMWHDAISVVAFKLCVYWHVFSQGQHIFVVEHCLILSPVWNTIMIRGVPSLCLKCKMS
jgi:hypothetical protein